MAKRNTTAVETEDAPVEETAVETEDAPVEETAVETEDAPVKEKLVPIRLPLIPGKEKQEAQFVRVNGRSWVIPRGVTMYVPQCVVEVLEHADEAALEAMRYQQANSSD